MEPGVLFVVATPIGNLEDITLRALRVLKEATVIACEDTRVTRKLLSAHQIDTPLVSYHAHSSSEATTRLIVRLEAGDSVALVSDAGTPLLSDPGQALVQAAIAAGISVVPIPGASALIAALSAAGLPAERVLFAGFPPRGESEQRELFAPLRNAPYTLVFYESPKRVHDTLLVLAQTLGDRSAAVTREMTKRFETFERGRLSELAARFTGETLGEIVIVVGPPEVGEAPVNIEQAEVEAARLLGEGVRPADVARVVAGAHGLSRQEAYKIVLGSKKR